MAPDAAMAHENTGKSPANRRVALMTELS